MTCPQSMSGSPTSAASISNWEAPVATMMFAVPRAANAVRSLAAPAFAAASPSPALSSEIWMSISSGQASLGAGGRASRGLQNCHAGGWWRDADRRKSQERHRGPRAAGRPAGRPTWPRGRQGVLVGAARGDRVGALCRELVRAPVRAGRGRLHQPRRCHPRGRPGCRPGVGRGALRLRDRRAVCRRQRGRCGCRPRRRGAVRRGWAGARSDHRALRFRGAALLPHAGDGVVAVLRGPLRGDRLCLCDRHGTWSATTSRSSTRPRR